MCDQITPARTCECGCGESVSGDSRFVVGHNMRSLPSPADRAYKKMRVTPLGCWEFTGKLDRGGYGSIGRAGLKVHRVTYEEWHGPIPPGLDIDHLCRNRACINPLHLEPVTRAENIRRGFIARGFSPESVGPDRTHCANGHRLDDASTYVNPRGYRQCRTCRNNAVRRSIEGKKNG